MSPVGGRFSARMSVKEGRGGRALVAVVLVVVVAAAVAVVGAGPKTVPHVVQMVE